MRRHREPLALSLSKGERGPPTYGLSHVLKHEGRFAKSRDGAILGVA